MKVRAETPDEEKEVILCVPASLREIQFTLRIRKKGPLKLEEKHMINKFLMLLLALSISSNAFGAAPVITGLSAGTPAVNSIPLSWSVASGGPATAYEMRYSTAPFDAGSFATAVPLGGVAAPTGGAEGHTVSGLSCGTRYWFAVKAYDAAGATAVSNVAGGATLPCTPSFSSSAAVTGASSLYAFTKGDFNNDGRLDLAFTVGSTRSIVFYPGNGAGGFGSPVTSTGITGYYPLVPTAGDFNRDGRLDLAVPNFSGDSVSILLGDGAGGFTRGVTVSTGDEPQDIAVNDFNRDGNPDIAVALWGGHAVAVFLGDGNSGFILKGNYGGYDGDARLNSIRSADLNGDGILDIVVADPGVSPYRSKIGVLFGNGDGSFQDRLEYTVGNLPGTISIGDLNRDGHPDIIATSYSENLLTVFTGAGNGTFSGPTTYAIGGNAVFSGIADFNGDGISDIAVGRDNSNSLLLLTGKGDGTFNDPLAFPVGADIRQAACDDFNEDGKPDVVSLSSYQTTVYSVLNTTAWGPSGNFTPPANYSSGYHPNYVTTGDINDDGIPDVITTSQFTRNFFSVRPGNADGTLGAEVQYGGVLEPHMPLLADFNGDGKLDLAIAELEGDRVSIRLGNGDGTFQSPLNGATVGDGPVSLVAGDFNGDGKLDLGVGHWFSNWFAFLLGNGDGTFQSAVLHDIGAKSFHPVLADFNGDGKPDIVTGNYELNSLSFFTGVGDGTFTHSRINLPGNGVPYLGDFNKDGKPDLAVSSNASGGSILILLGNGNGTFQTPLVNVVGRGNMAVGDLDRDGKPDILFGDYANTSAAMLRGNGDGTVAGPVRFATAVGTGDIAIVDFNRDGMPDIITSNVESDSISILLNTAPLPTVPQQGLVALWRAENNALDSIGGNHGTLQNGATYAAGRYGQAFSLNGVDDYLEIPNSPSLNPASAITVEAWYQPVSFAGNGNNAIVSKGYSSHSAPHYEYHLGVNGDQYSSPNSRPGSFSFAVSPNNNYVYVESAANLWVPGNWYHLVGTYDGAEVRLYVNGVLQASQAATGTLNDYGKSVRIGAFNNISSSIDFTPGLIDEVAIHNRALPATEIAVVSTMVPNAFSFIDQTGVPLSTTIVSNPITVTGISYATAISITGGDAQYEIGGNGIWLSSPSMVSPNATVKVHLTSSSSFSTITSATLTIGGVSEDFNVTTKADDEKPVVTGFSLSTAESTTMTVSVATFTATDITGVTGYMVTSSETPPLPGAQGWSATALPMSFTLATASNNTLYAWARDPAGNVSAPATATVTLQPVRRDPSPYNYYESISSACTAASSGETIKALAVTVPGSVTITGKNLTIKGGHADGYGSQSGYTTIGTLTIGTGSLTVDRVVVK
jgi:hypothetical protein